MVKASDWLHCRFDNSALPSKKTVRMRQQGKAVGCVSPTALLFVPLRQRSRGIDCRFVFGKMPELHLDSRLEGSRDHLRASFLLSDPRGEVRV
jgi:hypothetical protein